MKKTRCELFKNRKKYSPGATKTFTAVFKIEQSIKVIGPLQIFVLHVDATQNII